jgi:hypothetical protein
VSLASPAQCADDAIRPPNTGPCIYEFAERQYVSGGAVLSAREWSGGRLQGDEIRRQGATQHDVPAQQGRAVDWEQRPLLRRSHCSQQLAPSVDMTSDVKGCQPTFLGFHAFFPLGASEEPEPARCDG